MKKTLLSKGPFSEATLKRVRLSKNSSYKNVETPEMIQPCTDKSHDGIIDLMANHNRTWALIS